MIECAVIAFHMKSVKEKIICVTLHFRARKTGSETHSMSWEAYGNDALSHVIAYKWF
jgi:hypothetical protein